MHLLHVLIQLTLHLCVWSFPLDGHFMCQRAWYVYTLVGPKFLLIIRWKSFRNATSIGQFLQTMISCELCLLSDLSHHGRCTAEHWASLGFQVEAPAGQVPGSYFLHAMALFKQSLVWHHIHALSISTGFVKFDTNIFAARTEEAIGSSSGKALLFTEKLLRGSERGLKTKCFFSFSCFLDQRIIFFFYGLDHLLDRRTFPRRW